MLQKQNFDRAPQTASLKDTAYGSCPVFIALNAVNYCPTYLVVPVKKIRMSVWTLLLNIKNRHTMWHWVQKQVNLVYIIISWTDWYWMVYLHHYFATSLQCAKNTFFFQGDLMKPFWNFHWKEENQEHCNLGTKYFRKKYSSFNKDIPQNFNGLALTHTNFLLLLSLPLFGCSSGVGGSLAQSMVLFWNIKHCSNKTKSNNADQAH